MKKHKSVVFILAPLILVILLIGIGLLAANRSNAPAIDERDRNREEQQNDTNNDVPQDNDEADESNEESITLTNQGFTFEAEYIDNNWNYEIAGSVPTPCHAVQDNIIIAESFPEQVSVTLEISPPEPDIICSQVIEDISLSGTFQASPEAKVQFKVV